MHELKHSDAKWPEGLAIIYDLFMARLEPTLGHEQAHLVTMDLIREQARYMGGRSFYLPKSDALDRAIRDRKLYSEFTGHNHPQLCNRYDLCDRQVRNIIEEQRRLNGRAMDQLQGKLELSL